MGSIKYLANLTGVQAVRCELFTVFIVDLEIGYARS